MTVRIGGLRRRVTVLGSGGTAVTVGTGDNRLWVDILRETAGNALSGDGTDTRRRLIVRVRWRSTLVPGLAFSDGSRTWQIETTDDIDGRGRFLVCQCVEVTT